jgi:hypothetical protein
MKKDKDEYDKLIGFFKLLVWLSFGFITVIVTTAGIFLYRDNNELKAKISEVKEEASSSISNIEKITKWKIDSLNLEIKRNVNNKVNQELDDIFQTDRIELLIKNKVLNNVESKIKTIADNEYDALYKRIQSYVLILVEIDYNYRKIKEGVIPENAIYCKNLINIYESNDNEDIKRNCLNQLYDATKVYNNSIQNKDINALVTMSAAGPDYNFQDSDKAKELIRNMLESQNECHYMLIGVRLYNLKYNTDYQLHEYKKILKNLNIQ